MGLFLMRNIYGKVEVPRGRYEIFFLVPKVNHLPTEKKSVKRPHASRQHWGSGGGLLKV